MRLNPFSMLIFFQSIGASVTATVLVGISTVFVSAGFGAGDIGAFVIWSFLFAFGIGCMGLFLYEYKLFEFMRPSRKYLIGAMCGVVVGVLWTTAVASLIGAWFMAFSIPPLFCWIAGGISGLLVAANERPDRKMKYRIIVILLTSLTCSFVNTLVASLPPLLLENQKFQVVFVEWEMVEQSLTADPLKFGEEVTAITKEEMARLRQAGLKGHLKIVGCSGCGKGQDKANRVVILASHNIAHSVRLALPDNSSVIYVQDGKSWRKLPSDVPTLSRAIELWIDTNGRIRFWIENLDGSRSGGTAFSGWK